MYDLNLTLFPNLQLTQFPAIKSFHLKLLWCLFIYCKSFHNFCNHQIVASYTVGPPERSYIEYTRTSSPVYQYVIDLVVSLPISWGQVSLWRFRCGNVMRLTTRFFDAQNLLFLHHYHYYPDVNSRPQLSVWKYPLTPILHWSFLTESSYGTQENYWKHNPVHHSICPLNHCFPPRLAHTHSKQWCYTSDLSELYIIFYHNQPLLS